MVELGIPEDVQHDYTNICWWCGKVADTREHRYKRADLTREFGKGAWRGESAIVRVVADETFNIQGPNAKGAKFEKNLCADCNNVRSQPFDKAYDTLTAYIRQHESEILYSKSFELSKVFGHSWPEKRKHFEKYIIKHMCCRLAESKVKIPIEITDYLGDHNAPFVPFLTIQLEIREDVAYHIQKLAEDGFEDGNLWMGDLNVTYSATARQVETACSFYGYRWLRMNYWLNTNDRKGSNNFRRDKVILNSNSNLSKAEMDTHYDGLEDRTSESRQSATVDPRNI